MEEVEMIPDNECVKQNGGSSMAAEVEEPPAPAVTAATNIIPDNMDFWARMDGLMERKTEQINITVESLGGRIDQVKKDLEYSIAEERTTCRRASTPRWTRCKSDWRRWRRAPQDRLRKRGKRTAHGKHSHHPGRLDYETTTRTSGIGGETAVAQARRGDEACHPAPVLPKYLRQHRQNDKMKARATDAIYETNFVVAQNLEKTKARGKTRPSSSSTSDEESDDGHNVRRVRQVRLHLVQYRGDCQVQREGENLDKGEMVADDRERARLVLGHAQADARQGVATHWVPQRC